MTARGSRGITFDHTLVKDVQKKLTFIQDEKEKEEI